MAAENSRRARMGWNWTLGSPVGQRVSTAARVLAIAYAAGLVGALFWLTTRQ